MFDKLEYQFNRYYFLNHFYQYDFIICFKLSIILNTFTHLEFLLLNLLARTSYGQAELQFLEHRPIRVSARYAKARQ